MADVQAKLIVSVVDQATKFLKGIRSSIDGIDKSLRDNKKEIRDFGLAFTAAGGAVTYALSKAVEAGREQIAVQKQLNAVLVSTKGAAGLSADEIERMASSLQQVTNFDDEAILGAQTLILQFTKIGKEVFPQASEAALDISQRLGRDLTTVALQLGKALNDPADAMNALSRAGVILSDSQADVIRKMVEVGDLAGAQKFLLDELALKYGGAARAAAEPMAQLKNAIQDVTEEIGVALIPTINDLLKSILPLIQSMTEWIKQNPELTKTLVIITAALGGMLTVIGALSLGLAAVAYGLAAVGISLAVGGALFVAIGGITALIVVLTQHWDALKVYAGIAVDYIVDKFNAFLDIVHNAVTAVQDLIDRFNIFKQAKAIFDQFTGQPQEQKGSPPPFTARAKGGPAGGLTLVGEEGPELVSLPRGSYVHNAGETRKALGGVSLSIGEVHVHNEADEDRLVQKMTRMIQKLSLASA